MPYQQGIQSYIDHTLGCQRPIGKAIPCHQHTHTTRQQHRRDTCLRLLLHHHVLEEECSLSRTQTGKENRDESQPAQRDKPVIMIEICNERGTEEKDDIKRTAHDDVKPEHRVVIIGGRMLQVTDGRSESAVLECNRYQWEHIDHRHHSVVFLRQQSSQDDAEYQSDNLHRSIVHCPPEKSLGCFLLQCFCHIF